MNGIKKQNRKMGMFNNGRKEKKKPNIFIN